MEVRSRPSACPLRHINQSDVYTHRHNQLHHDGRNAEQRERLCYTTQNNGLVAYSLDNTKQ